MHELSPTPAAAAASGNPFDAELPFALGEVRVVPTLNRIERDGRMVRVEPKVMGVLLCLAAEPLRVVHRERLMEEVWPGTWVIEATLTRAVSELRRALGDDARRPRLVETIRKSGYRLLVEPEPIRESVRGDDPAAAASSRYSWSIPAAGGLVIAVAATVGGVALSGTAPMTVRRGPPAAVAATSFPGVERDAELSPDGRRLAFAWADDNADSDIWITDVGDGEPRRLTDDPAIERGPTFSPDGRQVAFTRYEAEGCGVWAMAVESGTPARLADCGENRAADLAWSPDGRWLAFSDTVTADDPDAAPGIVRLDLASGRRHVVTRPPTGVYVDYAPAYSPDGREIAFARMLLDEVVELFVVDVDGGAARPITADRRMIFGHAWAPDGRSLVFGSERSGLRALWRVAAMGGEPAWIALPSDRASYPALARRSGDLAYSSEQRDTDVWEVTGDGARPLIASARLDQTPRIAPGGDRVAFVSDRGGAAEVWIANADGTAPRRLTALGARAAGAPGWSPDAASIVFHARVDSSFDIYTVHVASGATRRLTSALADDRLARFTPDGQVMFASDREGAWRIWRLESSVAVPVTPPGARLAEPGPDGALYYATSEPPGIWRLDGESDPVMLVGGFMPVDWGNWAVSAGSIWTLDRTAGEVVIVETDLADGRVSRHPGSLPSWDAAYGLPGLAVGADGRVLITRMARLEGDVRVVAAEAIDG